MYAIALTFECVVGMFASIQRNEDKARFIFRLHDESVSLHYVTSTGVFTLFSKSHIMLDYTKRLS